MAYAVSHAVQERYFGFGDIHTDFLRDSCAGGQMQNEFVSKNPSSEVECRNDKYKVMVNIKPYKVEEISVRVGTNNWIKVEGQQTPTKSDELGNSTSSETSETSSPSSSFTQSFHLPSDAEVKRIKCDISDDGIFTIVAPRRYSIPEGAGLVDFPMLQL